MKNLNTGTVEVKRDILWRVYLSYIAVVIVCLLIFARAFYIQQFQGNYWRSMSDSLHQKIEETDADRGTIYSEDGQMLSTSIPQFDVYIDFAADGLRQKSGKRFRENVDSLSYCLADLFKDKSKAEYKRMLQQGYRDKDRYFLLRKKTSFREYQQLRTFPLVRQGRNKSGFIAEVKSIRLNPYQLLAYRTIGLDRENAQKVGLEQTYDTLLKGTTGKRLVRYIAGGVSVPVDNDYEVEPENGRDIITTLDVHIQEITENALMKMMVENEAEHGCAIVMEVKTGKVKAIANLGKRTDGSYWEDFNYALTPTEPGSTFKLATMLSLLEDKKVSLNTMVNLNGGTWQVAGRTVYDSENHGLGMVTTKHAFEESSNVGMAKLAVNAYASTPSQFVNHLRKLGLDSVTGIDLTGERRPVVYRPGSKYWSNTTLPWMAFGYNLAITPMHTAMLYNAVANNGKMLRPYLLSGIRQDGILIKETAPVVAKEKICSDATLHQLIECLKGVCIEGTGKTLFKGSAYQVAGKTGTALVANGARGYADHIYQSSFAGFFPADNPQYTCVVIIKNKPFAKKFYGAAVAGPVFKEIADRLYTMFVRQSKDVQYASISRNDSIGYHYAGMYKEMKSLIASLGINHKDSAREDAVIGRIKKENGFAVMDGYKTSEKQMPQLAGLGLKDAVYVCENIGLKVNAKGRGKVTAQSITAGQQVARGQVINIQLN
ncbi:penicillin-binding protein [Foetidibacter luteolus]|uniref:penicillin-binding protein n=1 Tax=Foetidibacter luteolus TaxID=2608880 RepID=UPI001F32935B|nr:penicillin-binding protein [Foetidibacter luteolus]